MSKKYNQIKEYFNKLIHHEIHIASITYNFLFLISFICSYLLLNYFMLSIFIFQQIIIKGLIWCISLDLIINLLNYANEDFVEEIPLIFPIILGLFGSFVLFIAP